MTLSFDIFLSILVIFSLGISSFFGKNKNLFSFLSSICIFLIPIFIKIAGFNKIIDINIAKICIFSQNLASISIYICSIFALVCLFCEKKLLSLEKYEVYHILSLLGISSSELAANGYDFLKIFVLLELMSIISVVLISGSFRHKNSGEAGLKYIISSSISSVIFLLGLAMMYFKFGNFNFLTPEYIAENKHIHLGSLYNVGIVLIFMSIFMKMGVFPFQIWLADVYSGTRISILNAINTLPKIGVMVCFFKLINFYKIYIPDSVRDKIIIFLVIGIVISSIRLISQSCLKRLLAYSSSVTVSVIFTYSLMVKSGNISLGSYQNLLFYIFSYIAASCIMSISCVFLFKKDDAETDLSSDNFIFRDFFYISLMIGILSLASIPPLLGFFAKFYFIKEIFNLQSVISKIYIASLIFSGILGSFYYFKLPSKWILLEKKEDFSNPKYQNLGIASCFIIAVFLVFGIFIL